MENEIENIREEEEQTETEIIDLKNLRRISRDKRGSRRILSIFGQDNAGITSVEIVLILVVLIALVIIFKEQITQIVEKAFSSIATNADRIIT